MIDYVCPDLDESGTHDASGHFVVAGIAVFERQSQFLARELTQLQREFLTQRRKGAERGRF